jgi:thiol:disulfide interchange protein DsbC
MSSSSTPGRTGRFDWWRWTLPGLAVAGAATAILANQALGAEPASADAVRKALAERLPRTQVTSVNCHNATGLCEVVAGQTLFYTDPRARYLMVGRIYDLDARADITAARLLELSPDLLLAGAPRAQGSDQLTQAQSRETSRIDPRSLPPGGGIVWGNPSGPRVVVFTDFACGYCRQLHDELRRIGANVTEYPISVLGSRRLTEAVWCARDRGKALDAVYSGTDPATLDRLPSCDTSPLDANEAFARRVGFTGTPVTVRPDGAVLIGYRPASALSAWLRSPALAGNASQLAGARQ